MDFSSKISFIQNSLQLNDNKFCRKFKIKLSLLKKWKSGKITPTQNEIETLCNEFNLDVIDFLNNTSTLEKPNSHEHMCAMKSVEDLQNTIYEDFPREDNSRYEEKD